MQTINSEDYKLFRSWVALQKATVSGPKGTMTSMSWEYFDYGPKKGEPLILLAGVTHRADVFYRQFLSLCPKGYRLISVQWPAYKFHVDWVIGFEKFLDVIKVTAFHLFGSSLGGYLAQCYMQYKPKKVKSLILSNSFSDTQFFVDNNPCPGMLSVTPRFILQRAVLKKFPQGVQRSDVSTSIDFMVNVVENMKKEDLASRLTLNSTEGPLKPTNFDLVDTSSVTIIDTNDNKTLPEKVKADVYKFYPDARVASMKFGGPFPYLSNYDEFNMQLVVHLRHNGVEPVVDDQPKKEEEEE